MQNRRAFIVTLMMLAPSTVLIAVFLIPMLFVLVERVTGRAAPDRAQHGSELVTGERPS